MVTHEDVKGKVEDTIGVMVFSATKQADRELMGDRITRWMASNHVVLCGYAVTQSSDQSFHCLSITLFYRTTRRQAE